MILDCDWSISEQLILKLTKVQKSFITVQKSVIKIACLIQLDEKISTTYLKIELKIIQSLPIPILTKQGLSRDHVIHYKLDCVIHLILYVGISVRFIITECLLFY
mgnify:CR=1 FL=1